MCGRYVLDLEHGQFLGGVQLAESIANFNVAPTHTVPILVDHWVGEEEYDGASFERRIHAARWGLVPRWAQEISVGSRAFNARSETLFQKPTFREAALAGHCAIPLTGYYEWKTETLTSGKQAKTPYFISSARGQSLYFAGLYEWWQLPPEHTADEKTVQAGRWLLSCSIITMESPGEDELAALEAQGQDVTVARELSRLHSRLPIPLTFTGAEDDSLTSWLRSGQVANSPVQLPGARQQSLQVLTQLKEATARQLAHWQLWPVDREVGSVRQNGPQLVEPVRDLLSGL